MNCTAKFFVLLAVQFNAKEGSSMTRSFKQILKSKTMTPAEFGVVMSTVHAPENKNKYFLTNEEHEDIIGKHRILTINPKDPENKQVIKLYEMRHKRDPVSFKIQYYDLLRDEKSNVAKAMRLTVLQKNIEMLFDKELRIQKDSAENRDLYELLQKIKKAEAYYAYKAFLSSNRSHTKAIKKLKHHAVSRPNDRGQMPEESPSTKEQDAG